MLRLALMQAELEGIKVIAPVHDAIVIEASVKEIEERVQGTQRAMRWASEQVLPAFPLETDVKVIRWPNRYMDEDRGTQFWNHVMKLMGKPPYISSSNEL